MLENYSQVSFVLAAQLSGRLFRMLDTARIMSISSSNAKCISIRGGDKTAGFRPITDFIGDMARDTIEISSRINQTALQFSMAAVNEKRATTALENFQRVRARLEDDGKSSSVDHLIRPLDSQIQKLRKEQSGYCKLLEQLFDDIIQPIRAARIIVTNSRTEASRADEYQESLNAIASDLEYCSQTIADEIKNCKNYLTALTEMIGAK